MAAANRAIDNASSDPKKRKLSRQREPKPWKRPDATLSGRQT
jgi:hypothetical protein